MDAILQLLHRSRSSTHLHACHRVLLGSVSGMPSPTFKVVTESIRIQFALWYGCRQKVRELLPGLLQTHSHTITPSYPSLVATRFLLGLFEAACLPLFAVITSVWYALSLECESLTTDPTSHRWRRAEQPLRVCMWYGTNGVATMVGSAMSYGLGRIQSDVLDSYQIIFLVTGFVSAPVTCLRRSISPSFGTR